MVLFFCPAEVILEALKLSLHKLKFLLLLSGFNSCPVIVKCLALFVGMRISAGDAKLVLLNICIHLT